jgi:dTDP-4-amino-4,6-dideoxygalactose transaminase
MKINHSKPYFTVDDEKSLLRVLKHQFVTNGPMSKKLGERAASYLQKNYGVPTQSGTDALTAAFSVMNLQEGAAIALPAYICSAPLDALELAKMKPVPVDIDKNTLAISVESVNERTDISTVLAAHLFGIPAPFYRLECENVLEDCAQTLGIEIDGYRVGSMGNFAVCSFYGTKLLTTGHGGLVAVNDDKLYRSIMELIQHDNQDTWSPHLHFQMSDLNAALGLSQFEQLGGMINKRREIAGRFLDALGEGDHIANSVYSRFLVVSNDDINIAIQRFNDAGIEAKRPVYKPLFHYLNYSPDEFPNAQWAYDNIISVPIYPAMTEEEILYIEQYLESNKNDLHCWPPA